MSEKAKMSSVVNPNIFNLLSKKGKKRKIFTFKKVE